MLETFGERIDRGALVTGNSGVFEVRVDGDTVFDKIEDNYDIDTMVERVGDRIPATA